MIKINKRVHLWREFRKYFLMEMFCFFFKQKAIAKAQQASQEDQEGKYEDAIISYEHAVKYFLHIVKRGCSQIKTKSL